MTSTANLLQVLTVPPSRETAEEGLLPELRAWFASVYGEPTPVQRYAWPTILQGQNLLFCSPTGSGKTMAAFFPILSQLLAQPQSGLNCLYIAPLKALNRDVRLNLKRTWRSIQQMGYWPERELGIGLRTGDTSQRVRQRQITDPPPILLTTPESLAQMLAHPSTMALFASLRWVIIDEVHTMLSSKRGADLSISLERLAVLSRNENGPQRIGLSATCTPLSEVAQFLVGVDRPCTIAQVNDAVEKNIVIEPLYDKQTYTPAWMGKLLDRLDSELTAQQTTLIFTNTRSLAERLTWALRKRYPDRIEKIAVHHSSLSAVRRRMVERRLKQGKLWAIVSSASLELGIDIGSVDSVVFVHPPGGVTRFLQRVGRSGHRPQQPRRGVLLAGSSNELLESVVTAGSGRDGQIESVKTLQSPLDILCQQIAGMAMTGLWSSKAAYELIRRAAPFRKLSLDDYQDCLDYLSGRSRDGTAWTRSRLQWEGDCFTIVNERTAKLLRGNLGSILTEDTCTICLRISPVANGELPSTQILGEIDSIYAERLQSGDRFVLDGRCLELKKRDGSDLVVDEVFGRPQIPRWLGSGVPMSVELARRIYLFRVQATEALRDGNETFRAFLSLDFQLNDSAIAALKEYFLRQETVSEVPVLTTLLVECVSMQSCVEYYLHTPLPRTANEVLARVLIHRFAQVRQAPMMAMAADLGIYVLSVSGEPLSADSLRENLRSERFAEDFQTHLETSDLVREEFARLAQTGLLLLSQPWERKSGRQRRSSFARRLYEQLRHRPDKFVLLRQAEQEVKDRLCDLPTACEFVASLAAMKIHLRPLTEPSPLGESLLRTGGATLPMAGESGGAPISASMRDR